MVEHFVAFRVKKRLRRTEQVISGLLLLPFIIHSLSHFTRFHSRHLERDRGAFATGTAFRIGFSESGRESDRRYASQVYRKIRDETDG